jgi:hypothetical protein
MALKGEYHDVAARRATPTTPAGEHDRASRPRVADVTGDIAYATADPMLVERRLGGAPSRRSVPAPTAFHPVGGALGKRVTRRRAVGKSDAIDHVTDVRRRQCRVVPSGHR